jgi:hypothetical protein
VSYMIFFAYIAPCERRNSAGISGYCPARVRRIAFSARRGMALMPYSLAMMAPNALIILWFVMRCAA